MVYIPNINIIHEMNTNSAGIWCETPTNANAPLLVMKLPLHSLKAISSGCDLQLCVDFVNTEKGLVLIIGVVVYDDITRPLMCLYEVMSNITKSEYLKLFHSSVISVHFFSERISGTDMPMNLMQGDAKLSLSITTAEINLIFDQNQILTKDQIPHSLLDYAHKVMQEKMGKYVSEKTNGILNFTATLKFTNFSVFNISEVTSISSSFSINDDNEGLSFEAMIPSLLSFHFNDSVYVSPYFKKNKEFADSIAFTKHDICIIQAGSLTILSDVKKSIDQRIEKHIYKKLKQCKGSISKARKKLPIFVDKGCSTHIQLPQDEPTLHGIALISEMHGNINWDDVATKIIQYSDTDLDEYYHVMDLQELSNLIHGTQSASEFMLALQKRWDTVHKIGNALVRFGGTKPRL